YRLFLDLAELFGVRTNREALNRLQTAWRTEGGRGMLGADREADRVSLFASRDSIVDVALLIDRLTVPSLRRASTVEEVARVRAIVKTYKRPPRFRWEVGDVFAVPLKDGSFGFGQVLWEQTFSERTEIRAPTCALLDLRAQELPKSLGTALASRVVAILHVQSHHLDEQEWTVIGRDSPVADPFSGPCGHPGKVGSVSWDGLEVISGAWHGLEPWNDKYRFEDYLIPGITRPDRALMVARAAFRYSNLTVTSGKVTQDRVIAVDVENIGQCTGEKVIEAHVLPRDPPDYAPRMWLVDSAR